MTKLPRQRITMSLYRNHGKRLLELLIASVAVLLLSPFILVLAAVVLVVIGRPVFFRQQRPGLEGKPFAILKFRTMTDETSADGTPLPDHQRLHSIGSFMRRWSLDELPELFNVARGDMSLVGPRPLLMAYLARYSARQMRRHEVRPGITGWAQINGRNALTWEQKFDLDVWYVDHLSLWLDLKILARTALLVLKRQGINAPGHATMPEFKGDDR